MAWVTCAEVAGCPGVRSAGAMDTNAAEADWVHTYTSVTGLPRVDLPEVEEAAMGTAETKKQVGPSGSDAPKWGTSAARQAEADTTGPTCTLPAAQVPPVATGSDAGRSDVPALQGVTREVDGLAGSTGKAKENQPASKGGDLKSSMEPHVNKSGVNAPTDLATMAKRPHPPFSNDGAQETLPGFDIPSAKTPQAGRSTFRPRPNIPPYMRGGNVEQVGQVEAGASN
ncbi:hypothetical protein HPB51_004878 [Rhipicephalus microplus]|uniref:Uncharacterized protein n=1 Tax=Rhipicephalus microplus TaxID=6941 RepID=A0A9J6E5H3_RHIMP|nr:hypothetical protein HPB51_004878 [Rhipicephalus microplus]